MEKMRRSHALAVFLTVALTAGVVWAETLEFVTYYPAGNSGLPDPLYVNSEGVGAGYNGQATPTNGLMVQGKVGMGTTNPNALLHIQSVLVDSGPGAPEALLNVVGPNGGTGQVLFMPGTNTASNDAALRVGIGIANPAHAVDIYRNYDAAYLRLWSNGAGDTNYDGVILQADPGGPIAGRLWQLVHKKDPAYLDDFRIEYNDPGGLGWRFPFVITRAQNVGIGTLTPSTALAFGGDVSRTIQMERHTVAGANGNPLVLQAGGAASGGTDRLGGDMYLSSGISTGIQPSNIYFLTAAPGGSGNADNNPTTKMTVTGNGNVGIGINNPGSALTVYRGADAAYVSLVGAGDGANYSALNLYDLGSSRYWQVSHRQAPANAFQIAYFANPGWSFPFTISTAGNVGINKTAPTAPLDVTGDIRASGDVYARGIMLTSDSRLKSDVLPLTGVLEKLDQIHGVSFRWSDAMVAQGAPADRREIGLIAQEVEKVFPELVKQAEYKGIDYSKMTAVLLEAVKELKAENESLKKRIELLEKKEK